MNAGSSSFSCRTEVNVNALIRSDPRRTQLSLIVLSLAPHWPEFSALWANRGSPSRETRPARLTGHRTICWAQSRSRPQAWTRNKLIGQKQRLSASSCTRTAETYSYLEIYHDINNTYKTNPKPRIMKICIYSTPNKNLWYWYPKMNSGVHIIRSFHVHMIWNVLPCIL